ncbi:hypothetical protein PACILC2_30430 [Paenibacillus cisolokensis]|uniref:Uncharacterized protein n=1 Tax=Paenibacillus cisolokensis TaxID=1658519 RepID=A0ABQ4N8I1_9BACL|nr:hypothetical protein PACILC2_30430 [Paenibacillus cisolokensis]
MASRHPLSGAMPGRGYLCLRYRDWPCRTVASYVSAVGLAVHRPASTASATVAYKSWFCGGFLLDWL